MTKRWALSRSIAASIGLLMLVSGCGGARGPAFQPIEQIPETKALVYIYRPDAFVGSAINYTVHAGDEKVVSLKRGGYYPYVATPGETEFWAKTEAKTSVTQLLEPGKTYYLEGGIGVGLLVGRPKLEFVDEAKGKSQVTECQLLTVSD